MTKAALCIACYDIVSPYRDWTTNRAWRWCQCDYTAVRWRDGDQGLLEVTSLHGPDGLRVIGLNNMFLQLATIQDHEVPHGRRSPEQWRALHQLCSRRVPANYLFHETNRDCWALVIRVGESGDVTFVAYPTVRNVELHGGG